MAAFGTNVFLRALPYNDVLIILKGDDAGKPTDEFAKWAESLQRQTGNAPVAPVPAVQFRQADGTQIVANVSGNFGSLQAGLYTIKAYREVVVEDPVSSSLALTITWTHNGKALTRTLSAFTGAPQQDTDTATDVTVVEIDANTTIGYSFVYASNTPGLAAFEATLIAQLDQSTE